jgi:hypothetical protein
MSLLVRSFVWKDRVSALSNASTTTASLSTCEFASQSYIVTLTDAAQTELNSLSAGEIVTKQFKAEHPHTKERHKRTNKTDKFSSHSTPETEQLICERVRLSLNQIVLIKFCSMGLAFNH